MRRVGVSSAWTELVRRNLLRMTKQAAQAGSRATADALAGRRAPPAGAGDWILGIVTGLSGTRRYRLFWPAGVRFGERLPLMVMLHGCHQDAASFAACTRMNVVAARERFLVLYPEQDRLSNPQGCWNWYDTKSGRARAEMALIVQAVDQVCTLYPADRDRVAIAGLSAGASMAALLATRHPERFSAVVMHSGIPPGTADSTLSAVGAMRGRRATNPVTTTPSLMAVPWPPLLVVHGDRDAIVSPQNGRAATHLWADAAHARASIQRAVQRGRRHAMKVTEYKRQGMTIATLVQVAGLGHSWSGGGANERFSDAQGPDASRMVWAFAARQFALARLPDKAA